MTKKLTLILAVLVCITTPAFAVEEVNVIKSKSSSEATATADQQQKQGNKQDITSNTTIPGQAPPIFVPNLTAVPETCMGSVSAGGGAGFGGTSFGISFGTTWKSSDCELRMFARSLQQLGPKYENAAVALLAQNDTVKKALQDAGVTIPGVRTSAVPAGTLGGGVVEKKTEAAALPAGIVALGPACGDGRPSVIRTGSSVYSCYGYDRDGLAKQ